jgi:hypothetical protein
MAKRKTDDVKPGRPRKYGDPTPGGGRSGVAVTMRMDPILRRGIDAYREKYLKEHFIDLDMTQVIETAVRKLITESGIELASLSTPAEPETGAK